MENYVPPIMVPEPRTVDGGSAVTQETNPNGAVRPIARWEMGQGPSECVETDGPFIHFRYVDLPRTVRMKLLVKECQGSVAIRAIKVPGIFSNRYNMVPRRRPIVTRHDDAEKGIQ